MRLAGIWYTKRGRIKRLYMTYYFHRVMLPPLLVNAVNDLFRLERKLPPS